MRASIIGFGHIGHELVNQLNFLHHDVDYVIDIDGVYALKQGSHTEQVDNGSNFLEYILETEIAFLAIPTIDDGTTAYNYIRQVLDKDIHVVTCEKGALGNFYAKLQPSLDKIGFSATVGGGTRLLKYAQQMVDNNVHEMHAIVNGTLNFVFDMISKGQNIEDAVNEAKKLGYAEPGAKTPLSVINKEATGDVPMKASILFNIIDVSDWVASAKDIVCDEIKDEDIKKIINENRRYIVSISHENAEKDVIGGFVHYLGDWIISGGFRRIEDNPAYQRLVLEGVDNSLLLVKHGKYYQLKGPGAGPKHTVSSMIRDARDFENL